MPTQLELTRPVMHLLTLLVCAAAVAQAADPPYYVRSSTWHETMRTSRDAMTGERASLLERSGLRAGAWKAVGPFTSESPFGQVFGPETDRDRSRSYEHAGRTLRWQERPEWLDGTVHMFEPVPRSAIYIERELMSRSDTTVTAYLGSDDGIVVWLNGKSVFSHDIDRGAAPNQERTPLRLVAGANRLTVKISNGAGPTGFYFSLMEASPGDLWPLVGRDFASGIDREEMTWEREDEIWEGAWPAGDVSVLGQRYLASYLKLAASLGLPAPRQQLDVRSEADLAAMRGLYITLRKREMSLRREEMAANIRTPKPPAEPRINGPGVVGARAGAPFLFAVPATGERPVNFSAKALPATLTLDAATGIITGTMRERGEYAVRLRASNRLGAVEKTLRIIVGDRIALTPPLGWNSWNCFADDVDESKVRSAADAMVSSGLVNHGWTYINIDDCWMVRPGSSDPRLAGPARDEGGMILTNAKFPDMKSLGDYVHARGLKLGIYTSPGPLTCAGYTGSFGHEEADARRFGEWGIDYLKYDWCSYGRIARDNSLPELRKPYEVMREALDRVSRDIVYSLCQYGMGDVWTWGEEIGGNTWRTTGDITDSWESMTGIGFNQAGLEQYAGPGHWNDPDMLVVGWVGWGPRLHPTRLTAHEQYTHITLWALLASPLLIGCDLTRLDDFTLNLLTNDEVLAVNQDPIGRQAHRVVQRRGTEIWARELADGSHAVGLFNRSGDSAAVSVRWAELGLQGRQAVRDVWRQKELGVFQKEFRVTIPRHGAELVRVRSPRTK